MTRNAAPSGKTRAERGELLVCMPTGDPLRRFIRAAFFAKTQTAFFAGDA
jgi:hypothetical protein